MSNLTDIFKENKKTYSHLLFGEDRQDLRDLYHIPKNESILVVAPLDEKNMLSSAIVTDRYIYSYDRIEEPIPLSRICEFVFLQEKMGSAVVAVGQKREMILYPKQVRRRQAGEELLQLLRVLQTNMILLTPSLKRQYEKTIASVLVQVRKSLHETGILNEKAECLLSIAEDAKICETETYFLRAENLYRMCDTLKYERFIESLQELHVRFEIVDQLKHPEELFFDSFVRDISNPYLIYITQNLIGAYTALRAKQQLQEKEAMILSYLCVRMDDELYLHKILNDYSRKMGEKSVWEIMCFAAKFANERMSSVYNRIISEEEVTLSELSWVDSLSLTPLHYALMLRNTKAVEQILEMKDWSTYHVPDSVDREQAMLYDFNFVASILYENPSFLRRIFLKTSNISKPIVKAINQLEQKIYINEKLGNDSAVSEYKMAKADLEKELSNLISETIQSNRVRAMRIYESGDDFSKYLMQVYENSDSLFHILTGTISEWRLYRKEQHFFVTNIEQRFNLSYYEWKQGVISSKRVKLEDVLFQWTDREAAQYEALYGRKKQEEKQDKKRQYHRYTYQEDIRFDVTVETPFEGSWFSARAHEDLAELKKEYRMLVKKYHPDNAVSDANSTAFQKIMAEHAEIIAMLK